MDNSASATESPTGVREILGKCLRSRWASHLLRCLQRGTHRPEELERSADELTHETLHEHLSELRELGLIERVRSAGNTRETDYRLTSFGRRAAAVLAEIETLQAEGGPEPFGSGLQTAPSSYARPIFRGGPWRERLNSIVEVMREISRQTDPQEMVRAYGRQMQEVIPADCRLSLSRRGLEFPQFRITRSSTWRDPVNPWKQHDRLPLLSGGLFAELLYSEEPQILEDVRVAEDDPAAEYLAGQRSLMAIPLFDAGAAPNMVILSRSNPGDFDHEQLPEMVWMANLFGRATHSLVLAERLREANDRMERELESVASIQAALLPDKVPDIATMQLAVHYDPSREAGGDYYDFLPLPDGRCGILIADVSGHGTPAAVLMAIMHTLVNSYPGTPDSPGELLEYVNGHLADRYTSDSGKFVTAFYGVYDAEQRTLTYANAGHTVPRLKECGADRLATLEGAKQLPLGITGETAYEETTRRFRPGDQLILYTDGITEAVNAENRMFGAARLDEVLNRCRNDAGEIIDSVLKAVDEFTEGTPAPDDRTLLVAKIT